MADSAAMFFIIFFTSVLRLFQETGIRIGCSCIAAFEAVRNSLTVFDKLIECFRCIVITCIADAFEETTQCDSRHRKVSSGQFRHTGIHILYIGVAGIDAVGIQVDLQSGDRLQVRPDIQVFGTAHDGRIDVAGVFNQPATVFGIVEEVTVYGSESKAKSRCQAERRAALSEDITDHRGESRNRHTVGRRILDIDTAYHHQEAAAIFCRFVEEVFRRFRTRLDSQFQMSRILVQDHYLCKVDRFVFDGIDFAVGSAGGNAHLLGEHTVLYDCSAVHIQLDISFQFDLFLFFLFGRGTGGRELLVHFLQELVLVVKGLQVQATLPVDLALVGNRVTELIFGVGNGSTVPVILRVVSDGTVYPIQYRDIL